jgi:hypothetical protein
VVTDQQLDARLPASHSGQQVVQKSNTAAVSGLRNRIFLCNAAKLGNLVTHPDEIATQELAATGYAGGTKQQ